MFLIWAPSSHPRQMEMLGQLGKCMCSQRGKKESCFCSVAKSGPALCNLVDCRMPGSSVLHHLPEFAQIHVHWVSDVIWPSHPLSPLLFLPSIFPIIRVFYNKSALCIRWQSIGALTSASVLPVNIQAWFSLGLTGLISLQSKGLSRVVSSNKIGRHQFFSAQSSLWSKSHIHIWLLHSQTLALTIQTSVGKVIFVLFNMLSRLVITFLPRSKHLLIS